MKKLNVKLFFYTMLFAALSFTACKNKSNESNSTPATTTVVADSPAAPMQAPVVISGDEELKKGVADATKDFSSVKAEVKDSVISLSGEIKRADWQKLNPTLNTLHPKRINSENLTIK